MIPPEQIFQVIPAEKLRDIARYLAFDPIVEGKLFSQIPETGKAAWLDAHRDELQDHFRLVGSSIFGKRKSYREIVLDTAKKIGVPQLGAATTPKVEEAIVSQVWKQAVAGMTEEQRSQLDAAMQELASKQGKHVGRELSGLAALGAAQLSGFGIYMLGSTLLGAVNGALGLGLGFGVFTGLSSLISVVIGPIGWVALGLLTVAKLGGPNYKKVLPVILVIATYRAEIASVGAARFVPDAPARRAAIPGDREERSAPGITGTSQREKQHSDAKPIESGAAELAPKEYTENSREARDERLDLTGDERPANITPPREPSGPILENARPGVPLSDVRALEVEIKQIAERTKGKLARTVPKPPPALSQREKTIFRLRNLELCTEAQRITGKHYLELSKEDQEDVREIVREQQDRQSQEEKRLRHQVQLARKVEENAVRDSSKKQKAIERQRREFERLLPNLTLRDGALERYLSFEDDRRFLALEQLKQLDTGNIRSKHHVPRTEPRLFQRDAGSDVRVYYRQNGAPNRLLVHLIGTKTTQDSDYEILRRQ